MDNLETIMQDKELVKKAVIDYLIKYHCPVALGLIGEPHFIGEYGVCNYPRNYNVCQECWQKALKNQNYVEV